MTPSFNLLDEPWIRVTWLSGESEEVSLLTLFRDATQIEGIHGEIASQNIAILRLLLAICHRTMDGPEDLEVWREYWSSPGSLGQDASTYLERFRSRFDLRDPEQPFFQVAGIHTASGKSSGLESLIADIPNGHPFFTTRMGEGLSQMTWAEAARWLIHVHAFDPSGTRSGAVGDPQVRNGKGYPIGPGWTGQIGTITLAGDNLEQTLLLNTVVCNCVEGLQEVDLSRDLPPWERPADGPGGSASKQPTGPVSCYTWQTRRVLLHGKEEVTALFLGNGDKATPQNRQHVEPLTAWRYSEPQSQKAKATVYMPRKLPTDRAMWRGLPTVVPHLSPMVSTKAGGQVSRFLPPAVITFYQRLMYQRVIPPRKLLPIHAVGMEYGAQAAVITELVEDTLHVPSALLGRDNTRLLTLVSDAIEVTEQAAGTLRNLAANLDRAAGGSPDTSSAARQRAGAQFYQAIDERFPRWLADIADADPESVAEQWREVLRSEAHRQAEHLAQNAPSTAFTGRGDGTSRMDVGRALFFFRRKLAEVLPRPDSQIPAAHDDERADQ
ncbi:MAG: CRISPR-associated Cse1 family protein [Actinomyces urogenitalis DORA_12]|uniref:CRISPR-associated Cse1 family protein n=1 Tax=Actinomyces urogenitalis DORA_12 TaxID=1403939 RepID=W1V8B1_9ACTO|nr:MAG: CRISPR-associated Cse1 family protein [Actinomyces urogenitalis DORA_12]